MRLSQKTIINQNLGNPINSTSDFDKSEFDGALKFKGYDAIYEKAHLCPCKSKDFPSALSVCKNCGGTGYIFVNPTKTKFIITGIVADNKLKEAAFREWGLFDSGVVNVTSQNDHKFSFMDRITLTDATSEHSQLLYPHETDSNGSFFVYTKYNIKSIDNIALYIDSETALQRLVEQTDYTFADNKILFSVDLDIDTNSSITIRYVHYPVFHIIDVVRESLTSYKSTGPTAEQRLIMPIKAIAKRAHLIKDVENFDGDRLLDNSWLPDVCEADELTDFLRTLKYTDPQVIFDNLTQSQKDILFELLGGSSGGGGGTGGTGIVFDELVF